MRDSRKKPRWGGKNLKIEKRARKGRPAFHGLKSVQRSFILPPYDPSGRRFLTEEFRATKWSEVAIFPMRLPHSIAAKRRAFSRLIAFGFVVVLLGGSSRAAGNPPQGWWRGAVFYEIFVRSFADARRGPLAGDGIGDFEGLVEHLDYLNDGRGAAGNSLGVTAVWLMPIQPSPSYHGYDVSDYFGVNPEFGDIELCRRFVSEAHRRGIRVIIDLVLNHASSEHPLFRAALTASAGTEERKMFRFSELPENIVGPWDQRAWHRAGDAFYYGVFSPQMPDWNFREPAVTEHHRRVARFWLEEIGVDGFRLDAVRYFVETGEELQDTEETRQWLREFTEYCHAVKPESFVVGEDTARSPEIARVIRGGSLDSAFEFDLSRAIYEAIRERTPGILMQALRRLDSLYAGDAAWSTFLTNHDQERVRTQLGDSEVLARFAAKIAFTLPGVQFFYYGDELGMRGAKPDPELRTPMPWTSETPNAGFAKAGVKPWHALNGDFATINVASESLGPDSMLALYRKLVRLNASSPAIREGKRIDVAASDRRVYAAMRSSADEVVLVVANFADEAVHACTLSAAMSPLDAKAEWLVHEELEGAAITQPTLTGTGGFSYWAPFPELGPHAVRVIRWTRR